MFMQVYESLKEYTLQGSAVGLMPNAQYALKAIHPNLLARQALGPYSNIFWLDFLLAAAAAAAA